MYIQISSFQHHADSEEMKMHGKPSRVRSLAVLTGMKKASWLRTPCILLAFILELLSLRGALSQTPGQASLIEGAKKEGKVVWYATLNISDSNALLHRFEQQYPFIKTELLRAGSEQLLNRILTEDSAGRSVLDLVNLTTIN